jgi:hypothetical protein
MGGWVDGRESGVKDCLQQSKNHLSKIRVCHPAKIISFKTVSKIANLF